jgi:hypothetical protein
MAFNDNIERRISEFDLNTPTPSKVLINTTHYQNNNTNLTPSAAFFAKRI